MIVSPSMSLVAAGVASGICFILFNSLRKGRAENSRRESEHFIVDDTSCACCLKPFLVGRGVRCNDCGTRSCRKGCSRWDTSDNAWHCLFCHQQRWWLKRNGKWLDDFDGAITAEDSRRHFSTAKSRNYVAGVENAATSSGLAVAAENQEEAHTMETVQNFVERIVEGLIGNVDDTPIDRLYDHPEYDKLLAKYIVPLAGALARMAVSLQLSLTNHPTADPPTMAHTALREIVERAVEEARKLPGLGGSAETPRVSEGKSIAQHSYEDLLATAILNKVIEKFQKEQVDGNSNVLHEKSASRAKCTLTENESEHDGGVENGPGSLEPLSRDECRDCGASCSRHARNQPEPLSLTIEERIEEVTTTYTSDEDQRDNDVLAIRNTHRVPFPELGMDIIDPSQESEEDSHDELDTPTAHMDMVLPAESWEENWLFQKKRVQTQADPVAMLVPNFNGDFKALIGDKDAEDTSDLSECSSAQSDEEIEKELMEAISNVVPRSPQKMEFDCDKDLRVESTNGFQSTIKETKESSNGTRIVEKQRNDGRNNSKETDSRILAHNQLNVENEINETLKESNRRRIDEESSQKRMSVHNSLDVSEQIETKEIIVEVTRQIDNTDQTIPESTRSVSGKIESERLVLSDAEKIEEKHRRTVRTDASTSENDVDTVDFTHVLQGSVSNSTNLMESSLFEGNVTVPEATTFTSMRISVTESDREGVSNAEISLRSEENILNSSECSKKKLIVVDDDAIETSKEEEAKQTVERKADFHTEDIQQEREYTEHYDTATQRHLDSLTKTERDDTIDNETDDEYATRMLEQGDSKCREAVAFAKAESASYLSSKNEKQEEAVQLATPPRPGTIAEREHKKWENAPPIENNPYSEENIQKRLWERQYVRRSSDIPGIHADIPKSNGSELDVVLTPHEPDIKRFGRDYYINNSKIGSGDKGRRSAASVSSRPSSSLSQRSSSTGADQEQQEETRYKETDSLFNRSNDVKSKVARWQNNNVETNYQFAIRRSVSTNGQIQSYNSESIEEECSRKNDRQRTWEDQRVKEILENERKNSKNEINAKLNNQENYDNPGMLETKRAYADENQKKIRRIDLKAYGFENEFCLNSDKTIKTSSQRVVNKLDLKSFGYDGGIRRTQSNNHLDSTVNDNDFKPRIVRATNKSNLTCHGNYRERNDYDDLIETRAAGDNGFTQNAETLNESPDETYDTLATLKSAKSVPNIAKCEYYNGSDDREEEGIGRSPNSYGDVNQLDIIKSKKVAEVIRNGQPESSNGKNGNVPNGDSENGMDNSVENDQNDRSTEQLVIHDTEEGVSNQKDMDKRLPMPSVRRLAQAFSKQPESTSNDVLKTTRPSSTSKDRSSTPEIQIVETPRQMHSLTARSLSKTFREGLRQIQNKVTSPPASHVAMEQVRLPENQGETVQPKDGNAESNDTNVISPGKLKSNIIFWEQLQRRS